MRVMLLHKSADNPGLAAVALGYVPMASTTSSTSTRTGW
jgi:hypothetical protein